jgi:hypothetical protein
MSYVKLSVCSVRGAFVRRAFSTIQAKRLGGPYERR